MTTLRNCLVVVGLSLMVGFTAKARTGSDLCSLLYPKIVSPALLERLRREPRLGRQQLSAIDHNVNPWHNIEAEQQYFYLGSSPRELSLGLPKKERAELPDALKKQAERELKRLLKRLDLKSAEFEMWPNYDDWGSRTWVIARYRETPRHDWKWLDSSFYPRNLKSGPGDPTNVIFPDFVDPKTPEGRDRLFENIPKDLYQRPEFGSSVWVTPDKKKLIGAWFPPSEMEQREHELTQSGALAVSVPPPARFNGIPTTFIVRANQDGIEFPRVIEFTKLKKTPPEVANPIRPIVDFEPDFKDLYYEDIKRFSGQLPVHDPVSGRVIDFGKLGSGQPDNQILNLVAYLKSEYEKLGFGKRTGFEVEEQTFTWRGIPQANLIVKIRGRLPADKNKPIIITDHIDKAIAEDIYEKTGQRVANPGADDNGTASATLRRAAVNLMNRYRNFQPEHDIWIVHFTGEEYPGSCLGSRYFVSDLLKKKQDIGANINLDMLGHRTKGDKVFQINPGYSPNSAELANDILGSAKALSKRWRPTVRFPWSRYSYINQTDSSIFDWAGYPTILINEHINLARRINPNYHQSTDLPSYVDKGYAVIQAKAAIETAARLAEGYTVNETK